MPKQEIKETQKQDFFKECESATFADILLIKLYARFLCIKRLFRSLKNRFMVG